MKDFLNVVVMFYLKAILEYFVMICELDSLMNEWYLFVLELFIPNHRNKL